MIGTVICILMVLLVLMVSTIIAIVMIIIIVTIVLVLVLVSLALNSNDHILDWHRTFPIQSRKDGCTRRSGVLWIPSWWWVE